ncbi:MAG TPA: RdgB/HAM1 family non-canonical purine NTP pyrophosphatase [Pseudomonadales bacterium]|nr:RdgB/HAM1 family non-canonical purine NTP pyrophosphatase [Pseudomonadales bacterium]
MKVVLASGNSGKLKELVALLAPLGIELVSQRELSIADADETASTFVENALIKARHAAVVSGLPALADDSGLVVSTLDGAPGVWSARYAGEPSDDSANNRKLIAALAGRADRRAYYYCALVFMRHRADPAPLIACAEWHGTIVDVAVGNGGFGYDPHFFVTAFGKTAAELPADVKNRVSHRGQAVAAMRDSIGRALHDLRDPR